MRKSIRQSSKPVLVLFILLAIFGAPTVAAAADAKPKVMHFAFSSRPDSYLAKLTTAVLKKVFARMGYGYQVNSYPQK
jgi:hypothetical protein